MRFIFRSGEAVHSCRITILLVFAAIKLETTTARACFFLKQRKLSFSAGDNVVSFSASDHALHGHGPEVVQTMPGDGDVLGDQVARIRGDFWFAPSCYTDRLMPGKVVEREDIKTCRSGRSGWGKPQIITILLLQVVTSRTLFLFFQIELLKSFWRRNHAR